MFMPALSPYFEFDHLLLPYADELAGAVLVSVAQMYAGKPFPALRRAELWLDSGGFAALKKETRVTEVQGLGFLIRPSQRTLTPQGVMHCAERLGAAVEFTLDFPTRDEQKKAEYARLSEVNALWRLAQPRGAARVFAAVQPRQDLSRILQAGPDGIGLGGLVPLAQQRRYEELAAEVRFIKAQMPADMPLHVFGIGAPQGIKVVKKAGATSSDAASAQRNALRGTVWGRGQVTTNPSVPEQLELATLNLRLSVAAARAA